mgnify:CR=1 FL=1
MKKVLLISTVESIFHQPVLDALRYLGYEVAFVDFRGSSVLRTSTLTHKIVERLPGSLKKPIVGHVQRGIDEEILKKAKTLKPDLILSLKAKNISVPTLEELRTIAPTVNWYPDTMNNWESIQRIVGHYDYFFEFDKYVVGLLQTAGHKNVYHLPFCGDISKNEAWKDTSYTHNVTFLGSYTPELYPMRLEILDKIKDLGLNVWGNKAWADTQLKQYYRGPVVPSTANLKKIYRQSKIVIHIDSLTIHGGTGLAMRPFDVTANGVLLIAQDDKPEIFNMFEPGKEFVLFHDALDIRDKVEYYLKHDEERIKIAKAGFERTRRDHTYVDRVSKILETIKNHGN